MARKPLAECKNIRQGGTPREQDSIQCRPLFYNTSPIRSNCQGWRLMGSHCFLSKIPYLHWGFRIQVDLTGRDRLLWFCSFRGKPLEMGLFGYVWVVCIVVPLVLSSGLERLGCLKSGEEKRRVCKAFLMEIIFHLRLWIL